MPQFKKYKLGELFDVSSGLSKSREEFGFGHPFVTFKDVFYNYFLPKKLSELANTNEKEIKSCSVKKGDIFLTRTSETMNELGMSSVALKDYPNATFNGFTKRLRLKEEVDIEIDPVFIGYHFRINDIRNQIDMHASMTTRASLNSTAINSIEISIPDIEYQIPIGNILKCLDDKIELNRRNNHTLEQIAQTLFKKYFVDDIDPENLPDEWTNDKIGNNVETILGGTPSTKNEEFWNNGNIPWINSGKANEFRIVEPTTYITEKALKHSNTKLLPKRTTIIAITGTTMGQISRLEIDSCANQSIIGILESEKIPSEFIYFWLKENLMEILSHATGGAQQHINKNNINDTIVIVPDKDLIIEFSKLVKPVFEKISLNCFENLKLQKIRDSLLPKLMSGEIEINATHKELVN